MRILFLMPAAPLAENISGAASRYLQNLTALQRTGAELIIARIDSAAHFAALKQPVGGAYMPPAESPEMGGSKPNIFDFPYDPPRLNRLQRLMGSFLEPMGIAYPGLDEATIRIGALLDEFDPDLVWVETTELGASVMLANPAVTWILSHHDIAYRVREIRTGARTFDQRQQIDILRRAETTIYQTAPIIVTASSTDADRLRMMGATDVRVISMGYDSLTPIADAIPPLHNVERGLGGEVRLIHLGSLETTANRVGLEAYLRKVHPHVPESALTIIGDAATLKSPLRELIEGDARVILAGYQPDLNTALHPYDLAILPYEHDTGYRTKLALLMRQRQMIIATRAAIAGSWIDGLDSAMIICERLDDFPAAIQRLWNNPAERARIADVARAFFESHYTHDAIQPLYQALLDEVSASA